MSDTIHYPQLSFQINNGDVQNTIYTTTDASLNKLTLKIITNIDDTGFTKGEPVPEAEASARQWSTLYLDLTEMNLTTEEFSKLVFSADGWAYKTYPATQTVCLSPAKDIRLDSGAGQAINIQINNLGTSNPPAAASIQLTVTSYHIANITTGDIGIPANFKVLLQNPPQHQDQDLHEVLALVVPEYFVITSIKEYPAVNNSLYFSFKPGSTPRVITAGNYTAFTVTFIYSAVGPGYGALTSAQLARKFCFKAGINATKWRITAGIDQQNPSWLLEPPADMPLIGEGAQSTVEFIVDTIVTDFQPGPTLMLVSYTGIPGYQDGSYSLLLQKIPHVEIKTLTVSPNPTYLNAGKADITVSWEVNDAGTMLLYPDIVPVTGNSYATTIERTTDFKLLAYGQELGTAGNVATRQVTAEVLPGVGSFRATPRNIYYHNFPCNVKLFWNITTHEQVTLTSSIDGLLGSFNAIGSTYKWVSKPETITLMPEGVSGQEIARTVVIAAFKVKNRAFPLNNKPCEMVVANFGSLLFITNSANNTVSVLDTVGLQPLTEIAVGKNPHGIALSPDSEFLYIANTGDATISVVKITNQPTAQPDLVVIKTIPLGKSPQQVAVSPDGTQIYVTTTGSNQNGVLYIITRNEHEFNITAKLSVGKSPQGVAVSPAGDFIVVANTGSNNVSIIGRNPDNNYNIVTQAKVGKAPFGVAISPAGDYILITNSGDNTVTILHTATYQQFTQLNVGQKPQQIISSVAGDFLFVANNLDNSVSMIGLQGDGNYAVLEKAIPVGSNPMGIAISPNGSEAFIADSGDSKLTVISLVNYEHYLEPIPLDMRQPSAIAVMPDDNSILVWSDIRIKSPGKTPSSTGQGARVISTHTYAASQVMSGLDIFAVAFSPDGAQAYVIQKQNGIVSLNSKNTADYTDIQQIQVGNGLTPVKLAISSDGDILYVSARNSDKVNVVVIIATATYQIIQNIPLPVVAGTTTAPLVATPDGAKIFVAQNNIISIIEKSASAYKLAAKTIEVSTGTAAIGVLPSGGKVITVAEFSYTVSQIDTTDYTVQTLAIPESYSNYISGLAIAPDGSNIVVANETKGNILFIDTKSCNVIYDVVTGRFPRSPVYLHNGSQLYVANSEDNTVAVIQQIQPQQ